MADGTQINPGVGGDLIATDDLTTLNGVPATGQKVQRVKVGYGSDGALRDVDSGNPLPVTDPSSQTALETLHDDVRALGTAPLLTDSHGQAMSGKLDTLHTDATATASAIVALGTAPLFTDAHGLSMSAKLDQLHADAGSQVTAVQAVRDRLPAALSSGRLSVEPVFVADTKTSATFFALNDGVTLAVPQGSNQVSMAYDCAGGTTLNVFMSASFDGGSTFKGLMMARGDTVGQVVSTLAVASAAAGFLEGAVPAGVTHIKAQCSAYTAGSINVVLSVGAASYESAPTVTIGSALQGSTSVIGGIFSPGRWQDLSSANLSSNATFTGGTHDLLSVASNAPFSNTTLGHVEYRLEAIADVAGTLYLEVSRDSTTWRRIKSVALAAASGSGTSFYGEIVHRPATRYARAIFINGATAQANFLCQALYVGS